MLAHVRPGIKGVYDLHDYLDEKREALSLWATRLKSIVEPPPSNVIALRASTRCARPHAHSGRARKPSPIVKARPA